MKNLREQLIRIRDRYANERSDYWTCHHDDCHIHRSLHLCGTAPCTCGLIHNLRVLPEGVAEILHPKYWDDWGRNEELWEPDDDGPYPYKQPEPISEEAVAEVMGHFGEPVLIEVPDYSDLIAEVFGIGGDAT